MNPTMKLRFVRRKIEVKIDPFYHAVNSVGERVITETRYVNILQQRWECIQGFGATPEEFNRIVGEWRDVPIEEESK